MKSFLVIAFVSVLSSTSLSQSLTDDPFVFATAGYALQEHSDLVTQSQLTSALAATSGTFSTETIGGHALARGFATYGQIKAYADVTMTKSGSVEFLGHSRGGGWFFDPLIFSGLVPEETYDVVIRFRISGDLSGNTSEADRRISGSAGLFEWDGDSFEPQQAQTFDYGDYLVTGGNNYWDNEAGRGLVTLFGTMVGGHRYALSASAYADAWVMSDPESLSTLTSVSDFYSTISFDSLTVVGLEDRVTVQGKSGHFYAVPEPSTMVVVGLGALAFLRRRRS